MSHCEGLTGPSFMFRVGFCADVDVVEEGCRVGTAGIAPSAWGEGGSKRYERYYTRSMFSEKTKVTAVGEGRLGKRSRRVESVEVDDDGIGRPAAELASIAAKGVVSNVGLGLTTTEAEVQETRSKAMKDPSPRWRGD